MASSHSALIALLVAVSCAAAASATTYIVGDNQGWTTGVDYSSWTRGKTFVVGDKLQFNYASGSHTVTEVNKNDYESCSSSNAISNDNNGPTTVTLNTPGTHYFICGVPGHCSSSGGMKLAVDVGGSASGGSPATPGTSPSGPNSASARVQAGPALAVAASVLVKLALF